MSFHTERPNDTYQHDPFWSDDSTVLYRGDRLKEFFPSVNLSLSENLNAIVRFSVYCSILLFLFGNTYTVFYIALLVLLFTYVLWKYRSETNFGSFGDGFSSTEREETGQTPTLENPFMNVLLTDYGDNPKRKSAAVTEDKERDKKFRFNLYRELGDVYERNHSERQYYTMPNTTIPNNRDDFAKWLYKSNKTLKEQTLVN